MALKLPDSAVPMGDFPVAKAVDIDFNDGENLQEKLDNGKLGGGGNTTDLTDLENRVTTNEADITDLQEQTSDLQEQIDNLDIPDITDLENASRVYCDIAEINETKGTNISLVVGEDNTEKIMNVLAPNEVFANWFSNENAYDRFGINSNMGTRINIISIQKYHNNDGVAIAITNKGKVLSRYSRNNVLSPWDYDNIDSTEINNKLTQLENNQIKKLFIQHQSPNEVYVKITACTSNDFSKILFTDSYGGSILITGGIITGADYKTIKVVRLTNGDWNSHNPSTNTLNKIQNVYLGGTDIYIKCSTHVNLYIEGSFISAERVYSIPSNVKQLPILDLTQQTDLTSINTKLTQLENTINEVGGGGIYQSGEIEVGTWTGGQKLYRYTISDNTEQTISNSGILRVDFFTLSRDKYAVVKLDGTFRMCAASDNSGAHTVYTLPYIDLETNRQVHLVYTTMDKVRLSGVNLTNYKILGFDVSIYYYKK